ncbi:hypothetical protein CG447_14060 [Faecalibacterium duncaniae]|nr:hypothetical protein CG447_14060 [Faecalibacterium duncaniae]
MVLSCSVLLPLCCQQPAHPHLCQLSGTSLLRAVSLFCRIRHHGCTACGRFTCRKRRPECGCQPKARQADPDRGHQRPACRRCHDRAVGRSGLSRRTDFLREIVHLVKRLGYNVICEGIETEEQVQLLRSLDCDGAQGFWFSKAIPAEEFERRYLCS